MNDLVFNGIPKSRFVYLVSIARSMIDHERRNRKPKCDVDLEKRISSIVEERPYLGTFKDDYIYTREFINFDDFRKHMEWGVSDYNTKRPYSLLNYMTPEEFESAILNEDFKKKLGGTNMMNYLNEHGKLSEES